MNKYAHAKHLPTIVTWNYSAPVDTTIFVNPSESGITFRVKSVTVRPNVVGSDGGSVTMTITRCDTTEDPSAGDAITTAADLKGTIEVDQALTLDSSYTLISPGHAIGANAGGTTTAAVGLVVVVLEPVLP